MSKKLRLQYIGVNDHSIDLFEGQYPVPNGMAYNSYLLLDERIAVTDTVDAAFGELWLERLHGALGEKTPDYLILHHMEPDHSSNVVAFMKAYPEATVVASEKAFGMMKQFFGEDYPSRRLVVKDGDRLSLGATELEFIAAPMVHWPEVLFSYLRPEGILFSADAFGKFGALDCEEEWENEAARYYFGIVGKYGAQVQKVLARLQGLELRRICPLHGPSLESPAPMLELYRKWSAYEPESEGVTVAFTSVYGNTKRAAERLASELRAQGARDVVLLDLARTDLFEAVSQAFRHRRLALASTTYNGEVFPAMRSFLQALTERGFRNRRIGLIENGSWAPMAAKRMRQELEACRELAFCETIVTVRSAMTEENKERLAALAEELLATQ